jgi:transposase
MSPDLAQSGTLTSRAGMAWLATVHLESASEQALRRLERLPHARGSLGCRCRRPAGSGRRADRGRADRLVGIGPVLSLMLQAEFCPISRFPRRAALACHAGLVNARGLEW